MEQKPRPCSHMDAYLPSHARNCAEQNGVTTEQKHSPLPWVESDGTEIKDANGILCVIASSFHLGYKEARDNRELIVRSVNSTPAFDALIEAAGKMKGSGYDWAEMNAFEAALAEAKKARGI